jgi:hypothetical protein
MEQDPSSVAFLPFIATTYNRIYGMLSKHIINMVGILPRNISTFLWTTQDDLPLKTMGIYSIPCKCVGKFTLDKLAVLLKPGSRNTITISDMTIQISQLWPNTAST